MRTMSPAAKAARAAREQQMWEKKYGWLCDFVASNGRMPTQGETMPVHDFKVGQWVDAQRAGHRRGDLPLDRARRLESLPGWVWSRQVAAAPTIRLDFVAALRVLVDWMHEHGAMPTATTEVEILDGVFRLGAWCHRRKVDYRVGRLSLDRFDLLDQTRFWEWAQPRTSWMETYRLLCEWVAEQGCLPGPDVEVLMPVSVAASGVTEPREDGLDARWVWLGNWVRLQRRSRGRGRLSAQQVWLLSRVPGWEWPDTPEAMRDLGDLLSQPTSGRGHLAVVPT